MYFITVISLFLFLCYAILIIYYRNGWGNIPIFSIDEFNNTADVKVTIIIPARNEEKNIDVCLNSVYNQSYPLHLYQVIVVDDYSTDNTANIVSSYSSKNVALILLQNHLEHKKINSYKKKAIEIAIQHATGDLIITTDADCVVPYNWIKSFVQFYKKTNAAFIAAPVAYFNERNFLSIFQSLDFMTLQGITGAAVYKKVHSTCNGANLAYEKNAFIEVNGFKNIDNIASGDDMLLMHKIYTKHPERVFFLKSKEVIVKTSAMDSLQKFIQQRIRWASKADKYDDKRIFAVLLMVYLFNAMFIALPLAAIFVSNAFFIIKFWLLLLLLKTIVELVFLYPVAKFFSSTTLLWWFPIAQPFHIVYTVVAGWLGKFGSYQWKDRTVK